MSEGKKKAFKIVGIIVLLLLIVGLIYYFFKGPGVSAAANACGISAASITKAKTATEKYSESTIDWGGLAWNVRAAHGGGTGADNGNATAQGFWDSHLEAYLGFFKGLNIKASGANYDAYKADVEAYITKCPDKTRGVVTLGQYL